MDNHTMKLGSIPSDTNRDKITFEVTASLGCIWDIEMSPLPVTDIYIFDWTLLRKMVKKYYEDS